MPWLSSPNLLSNTALIQERLLAKHATALLAKYSYARRIDQHIQNCRLKKGQADFADELSCTLLSHELQLQACSLNSSTYQHYLCCIQIIKFIFLCMLFFTLLASYPQPMLLCEFLDNCKAQAFVTPSTGEV